MHNLLYPCPVSTTTTIPVLKTGHLKRHVIIPFFLSLFLFVNGYSSNAQIITSFAGIPGPAGYSGDGGPAVSAKLAYPIAVTTDKSGNVYIADFNNHVIRKVNGAGIISTIAGNNIAGYSGDGGAATAAQLNRPTAIVCDDQGNLYITDSENSVIRKVDASGIISTIAGNGTRGYSGDGGAALSAQLDLTFSLGITVDAAGNLYLTQPDQHLVRKINSLGIITTVAGNGTPGYSGDGGPATSAQLNKPIAVLIDDAGNVYISNANAQVIRKINALGIISTFAGTGSIGYSGDGGPALSAQFSVNSPMGMVKDACGNIYVADYQNSVIRKINPAGIIETIVGNGTNGIGGNGGPALSAELWFPIGMAVDPQGNIYILDVNNNNIRKVSNPVTSSITLQPQDVNLCNIGNTSFTINANNASGYLWQVNTGSGWADLTDNIIYSGVTTNTLNITGAIASMSNYQFRCIVKTMACGELFSDPAGLTITTALAPSITIAAPAISICQGIHVTFTATPQNGGSSPSYQWTKNGLNIGTNSSSFTDINLNDGDIIECILTSSNSCVATNTASSNKIVMQVTAPVTPSVSIAASATTVCSGTAVSFTSTALNGGTNPVYTWFKNGVNLFYNSPVYTDNTLNDQDEIMCVMRSNAPCPSSSLVISNAIFVNVTSRISPTITISTPSTSVCPGNPVTFTATFTSGASAPVFLWQKNGNPVGTDSIQYTDSNILQGDRISCVFTNTNNCYAVSSAMSNSIAMNLLQNPVVSLNKTPTLCNGDTRQLDAGSFASYLWNDRTTSRILSTDKLGTYYVTVTDNNGCKGGDTVAITTLLPLPQDFLPADASICNYGKLQLRPLTDFKNYQWSTNELTPSITISKAGRYSLQATDQYGCVGKDSIVVNSKDCLYGFYIPNVFTPNNDGRNDSFKPMLFGRILKYNFVIYNRWGQKVFETNDVKKGWTGNHTGSQSTNQYVWSCTYQMEGEAVKSEKGTVILMR